MEQRLGLCSISFGNIEKVDVVEFSKLEKRSGEHGSTVIDITVAAQSIDESLKQFYSVIAHHSGLDEAVAVADIEASAAERFSADGFRELKRDFVVGRATHAALSELGLAPELSPKVHVTEYPQMGSAFSYELSVVERPSLDLSDIGPVTIAYDPVVADDAYVASRLEAFFEGFATYELADARPVQLGDHIDIDLMTLVDGKPDHKLTGSGKLLDVDYDAMPKSFIDKIIGMEVGETRTFEYNVLRDRAISDDDFDHYLATITVNAQKRKIPFELSDEWVKAHYPTLSTCDEFLAKFREETEQDVAAYNEDCVAHLANVEIEKRLIGTIPDEYYQASSRNQMDKLELELKQQGKTLDDYYEENGTNQEEFSVKMLVKAGEGIRQAFALEALFDKRAMVLTDAELENAACQLFGEKGHDLAELERSGRMRLVRNAAKRIKAARWLVDTAIIVSE